MAGIHFRGQLIYAVRYESLQNWAYWYPQKWIPTINDRLIIQQLLVDNKS